MHRLCIADGLHACPGFAMMSVIDSDDKPIPPFDSHRWLDTLTPDPAGDMRAIIEATNPRIRAAAVEIARHNGRSWRNIATAITANEQRPPAWWPPTHRRNLASRTARRNSAPAGSLRLT